MKGFVKTLCVALLAAGLMFPACKKESDNAAEAKAESMEEAAQELAEAEEEEAEAEEAVAEAEEEVEDAAEINEDNYIKAAFEVACVSAHIDDPARASELKDEIYPRYGFDEATFKAAQEALAEKDTVKAALNVRMESCTKELAEKLGEAGAESAEEGSEEGKEEEGKEEEGKEEAKKPAAKPVPAKIGTLKDSGISGGGFTDSTMTINVRKDFSVSGDFRGKREGATFTVPFKGTVDKKGTINANGNHKGNSITVSGRLNASGAQGGISGSVHKNNFKTTYNAK